MTRRENLRAALYAAVLLWMNAYICRTWFFHPTAHMNSLDGYWAAVARLGDGWLHPSWWPFWDIGIPFEFTSAPIVPAMTAAIAALARIPQPMALQAVKAIFYCAAPLALFLMAWRITRAPGYSFAAGLFYSLLSPAKILAPDTAFAWADLFSPNRFILQAAWDETPRVASVTFLLLFILLLVRSLEKRTAPYFAAAAVLLAFAMLASPFAAPAAALSVFCLLTAQEPIAWRSTLVNTAGIALLGYALAAGFLPPSTWLAMAAASAEHEPWSGGLGLLKLLAASAVLWVTLVHYLPRWTADWRLRFFALLAFAMSYGPILSVWLDRQVLPQPQRFRMEMEPALALAVVFGLRPSFERLPRWAKAVIACALLFLAGQQMLERRRLAKDILYPADVTKTIEYRTAIRVAHEFPGARVMMPGSIAHWANAFTDTAQFSGSEGTAAYSQIQQRAMTAIYDAEDARAALPWLKAYGAAAVVVSGPLSRENWKPFAHPEMFDGVLPTLWSEDGVTLYRVPQRTPSLAHVIPENALVTQTTSTQLDRYNAALDDPAFPEAALEWQGRNRILIRATGAPGQVISIQVSYHPGWHAAINGRPADIHADGLGIMWLRPDSAGPALVDMHYDGGWELRVCRWLSVAGILVAVLCLVRGRIR